MARGWTVAEFAIAMLLSLLVVLCAGGLLLAATGGYRSNGSAMQMHEAGCHALAVLAQSVRQSAYVNWEVATAPVELDAAAAPAIVGLDARSISRNTDGISNPLAAVAQGSDVLAVRFAGSGGAAGDGSVLNCAGFAVRAPISAEERGWSIFYVGLNAQREPELRCKYRGSNGWGADAIVRGVDSFQVLYGLDTDAPPDGVPNTYANASAIDTLDAGLLLVGGNAAELQRDWNRKTHWKRVCSVKVALLLRGEAASRPDSVAGQFDVFGSAYAATHGSDEGVRVVESRLPAAQQRRVRQVFSTTILLRNRSGG
ncbi:MAG: PilW family protein [Sphingomonadaceae bacterium]